MCVANDDVDYIWLLMMLLFGVYVVFYDTLRKKKLNYCSTFFKSFITNKLNFV